MSNVRQLRILHGRSKAAGIPEDPGQADTTLVAMIDLLRNLLAFNEEVLRSLPPSVDRKAVEDYCASVRAEIDRMWLELHARKTAGIAPVRPSREPGAR